MTTPVPYDDNDEGEVLPATRSHVSEQSRGVALVLAIFGGWVGLHRFYTGRWKTGVAMAFTMGGMGIWWVYDLILIGSGDFAARQQAATQLLGDHSGILPSRPARSSS